MATKEKKEKDEKKVSELDKVRALIDQKFGKNTLVPASKVPPHIRLTTGIVSFDIGHGGGLARGGVHIIWGLYSSGKTTTACKTIAANQRMCRFCNNEIKLRAFEHFCQKCMTFTPLPNGCITCGSENVVHITKLASTDVAKAVEGGVPLIPDQVAACTCGKRVPCKSIYVDNEGTFDPLWAYECGVDLDALEIVRPDYAEQSIDIMEALVRTGEVDIIAWDSIPSSTPAREIEDSAEDSQMGVHARLINKACRVLTSGQNSLGILNPIKPLIIAISQPRTKLGVMHGDPDVLPGGRGQEFTALTMTKLWPQAKMLENGKLADGKTKARPVGNNVHFKITKNKTFPPFQEGNFVIFFEDGEFPNGVPFSKAGINNDSQLIEQAITYGLVTQSGTWFSYGSLRAQGKETFALEVASQADTMEELKESVLDEIKRKYKIG